MDAWLAAAVGADVETACAGGRIDRVGQPRPSDVVLQIHTLAGPRHLLLSADPGLNRAHLVARRPANPVTPPPFCQLLRRHIEGARVAGCRTPGLERVLELRLRARDELGNPRPLLLIAELTGRLANIVLVGPDGRVIDALRRVPEEVNRRRQLQPGVPYLAPPRPEGRLDPVLALEAGGPAALRADLVRGLRATSAQGAPARLMAAVFGLTPALAAALAGWAGGQAGAPPTDGATDPLQAAPPIADGAPRVPGPDLSAAPPPGRSADGGEVSAAGAARAETGTEGGGPGAGPPRAGAATPHEPPVEALAAAVGALAASIRDRRFRPCVLATPRGPQPSAWPLPGFPAASVGSASEACARAYEQLAAERAEDARRRRLAGALRAALDRTARRIAKQEEEWARAEASDDLRLAGELLLAYGHLVPRGADEALLPAFDDPERRVAVRLDPALSPAANAQRLLRSYRKERRARGEVAKRLEASRAEWGYLSETALALEQAEDGTAVATIEAEMTEQGLLRPRGRRRSREAGARPERADRARAGAPPARLPPAPPLRFAAEGGWAVLVGRSAGSNDHLTMHLARPDDVWLHARQIPGSHVLLQPPADGPGRGEPPEGALLAAARCAAHFSAGRDAAHTAVDFTLRRHVWKPAGARPGFVLYRHERTLVVEPSELPPRVDGGAPPSTPAGGARRHGRPAR